MAAYRFLLYFRPIPAKSSGLPKNYWTGEQKEYLLKAPTQIFADVTNYRHQRSGVENRSVVVQYQIDDWIFELRLFWKPKLGQNPTKDPPSSPRFRG
jgi:hypothetical protein